MERQNGIPPLEVGRLVTRAGLMKASFGWLDLILRSFLGGLFISLGALFDILVAGGATGLRASNPSLASALAAMTFPVGFVMLILTGSELVTSNFFVMTFSTLQRKTTPLQLLRNWVVSYVFNLAGALFTAGFLAWWSSTLDTPAEQAFAVAQAEARVNLGSYWSVNFLRGVGCNWLVGMALFLSTGANEYVSKIYSIWVPIWTFVFLGYQHSIANYFLIPIGMFYGTDFSVGEFIYKNEIPVTLGNLVGGTAGGAIFWYLYGRDSTLKMANGAHHDAEKPFVPSHDHEGRMDSEETISARNQPGVEGRQRPSAETSMV